MNHQIPTPFFDRNTQGAPDYSETTASERYFIAPTTPAIVHRQFSDIHNILSNLAQQNELNTKMAIPTE